MHIIPGLRGLHDGTLRPHSGTWMNGVREIAAACVHFELALNRPSDGWAILVRGYCVARGSVVARQASSVIPVDHGDTENACMHVELRRGFFWTDGVHGPAQASVTKTPR